MTSIQFKKTLALLAALALTACGGGGGDGGGGSTPTPQAPSPSLLSLSPSAVNENLIEGYSTSIKLVATPTFSSLSGTVYIVVVDAAGVIEPNVAITPTTNGKYDVTLLSAAQLKPGQYNGTIEVRICPEPSCKKQFDGSPTLLPYSLKVAPAPAAISLGVTSLDASFIEGEAAPIPVTATIASAVNGPAFVRVTDSNGTLTADPVSSAGGQSVTLNWSVAANVTAGPHSGQLAIQVCRDALCTNQYPGSPVTLPYSVKLLSATNLTPLAAINGAGDWETFQGSATHTGYVPVTVDATRFTPRWRRNLTVSAETHLAELAAGNGKVYTSISGYFAKSSTLAALNEFDGATAWSVDFGTVFALNPPAVTGGNVFVATSGHENTFMWSFDAATGAQKWKTAFSSQWEHYLAPTVDGGAVFSDGGYYGGMVAFDATAGGTRWAAPLAQYDGWTPALDSQYAYAAVGGTLSALNRADGSLAYSFSYTDTWAGWTAKGAPILVDASHILISGADSTVLVDLAAKKQSWTLPIASIAQPATANGIAYLANGQANQIEARKISDGTLLWSLPNPIPEQPFKENLVVTDNLLFFTTASSNATTGTTIAVDLATRKTVWTRQVSGKLAISKNGVLYIAGGNGTLTAENLK